MVSRSKALWLASLGFCNGANSWSLPPRWGHTKHHASTLLTDTSAETVVLADASDFVKPERDMREYRAIRLPNNLQVLLVSDNMERGQVGVEAASVHVQAGHMDDTIPGLAQ